MRLRHSVLIIAQSGAERGVLHEPLILRALAPGPRKVTWVQSEGKMFDADENEAMNSLAKEDL
jgi:hypothetical protein